MKVFLSGHELYAAQPRWRQLSDYTEYDLKEYYHALKRLESYLAAGESVGMEEADARIYHSYLIHEHSRFVQLAKEIDDSYQELSESDPATKIEINVEGFNG